MMPRNVICEMSIILLHEMSLVDDSKLTKKLNDTLFSYQNSLSLRTAGYNWFTYEEQVRPLIPLTLLVTIFTIVDRIGNFMAKPQLLQK